MKFRKIQFVGAIILSLKLGVWLQAESNSVQTFPELGFADAFADRGPVDLALGGELAGHLQAIDGDRLVFADGDRVGLVERDTATTWTSPPLPLDTEFSEVVDVRIGEELALVAIGSEVGPNRRLVVLERASGRIRWTLDGIRTADETRGRVIYDRRNPDVLPEGLSRDVFVVDAHDPSRVIWSAPSKGDLGGFIAPLDDADVFIHRDPAIWPRAPYPTVGAVTEVQIFDPELILVSGAGTEVEELRGGDSDLRDDRRLIVADGDRMVVLLGGALHVAGRSPMTIPIDMASGGPIGLLAHENVTIVAFGRPEIGCH